ncbi:MAG: hypothetical protein V1809_02030, partial [Planctomycetota bacterium]
MADDGRVRPRKVQEFRSSQKYRRESGQRSAVSNQPGYGFHCPLFILEKTLELLNDSVIEESFSPAKSTNAPPRSFMIQYLFIRDMGKMLTPITSSIGQKF